MAEPSNVMTSRQGKTAPPREKKSKLIRVAVVIPAFQVAETIAEVVRGLPAWVWRIYVVDDGCPEASGEAAAEVGDSRVTVLHRDSHGGTGAAVKTGYRAALEDGAEIIVKMDGDGGMDATRLADLLAPVGAGAADFAKGNRLGDDRALARRTALRLLGGGVLSFLVKAATGYWTLMDPVNGYTAVRASALRRVDLNEVADGDFFDIDLLVRFNILSVVAVDVPMDVGEADESGPLRSPRRVPGLFWRLSKGFFRRLLYRYYLYDFNVASMCMLLGAPLLLFGLAAAGAIFWASATGGAPVGAGRALLAALPATLGLQLLLQAVSIDIASVPGRRK
jgi:glycosyltransferase involved in cell wall biosynthesis